MKRQTTHINILSPTNHPNDHPTDHITPQVVDSVAALVPKAELDGDIGDHHIALQARLMSQALRKLTGTISKTKCLLIFINQIRQKVGVIFGSNEVTTGGTALRFYSSVRASCRAVPCRAVHPTDLAMGKKPTNVPTNRCGWRSGAGRSCGRRGRTWARGPRSRWSRTSWRRPSLW